MLKASNNNPTPYSLINSDVQQKLNSVLEDLQSNGNEAEAFIEYLNILTEYSAKNNWSYTHYFLEKASESLECLDMHKQDND